MEGGDEALDAEPLSGSASVDDTAASVANATVKPGAGTRSEDDVLTWTGVLTGTLETLEAGSCVTGTVPLLAPLPVEELLPARASSGTVATDALT